MLLIGVSTGLYFAIEVHFLQMTWASLPVEPWLPLEAVWQQSTKASDTSLGALFLQHSCSFVLMNLQLLWKTLTEKVYPISKPNPNLLLHG
jgi:hypothetical protein